MESQSLDELTGVLTETFGRIIAKRLPEYLRGLGKERALVVPSETIFTAFSLLIYSEFVTDQDYSGSKDVQVFVFASVIELLREPSIATINEIKQSLEN